MDVKKSSIKKALLCLGGSAVLAFGLCHVHAVTGITEGGVLGLSLWFYQTLGISPAVSAFVLNAACYLLGAFSLGTSFVFYSAVACGGFSLFYFLFDLLPPVFSAMAAYPLLSAVLGAVFVGIGVGLSVLGGGAPSGDDALAMSLCALSKKDIRIFYLLTDVFVLLLSLTYIPPGRIVYSFVSVILSGQIIGWIQKMFKSSK